ncbi:asparagine--tRNA ligase [bacterium]|nr:asparagine--tRNA ligase [candidate division CSSED10-310 bacterium]
MKIKQILNSEEAGVRIVVKGWIRTKRSSKNITFIELNDGSTINNLQVIAESESGEFAAVEKLGTGAAVAIHGELRDSPGKGQRFELKASRIEVIGESDPASYPLQKKRHSFEFLRQIAHLRPRTNTFGCVLRVRNALSYAIHEFFQKHGFVYIHTPIITGSDCEGAGELFKVTTLDLNQPPRSQDGGIDFEQDFFKRPTYLTVSGQLEGELFALALGDIYTFGPTFRAENSNTTRHLAEFWMIEPEMAFYDLRDNMDLAESFLKEITAKVIERCPDDMTFFDRWIENGLLNRLRAVLDARFIRLSYTDAMTILQNSGRAFDYPVEWGCELQTEHERYLTEQHFKGPVIVYDYPREFKSFYMRVNDDGRTVAAMDVLVPKIGEIIGGSQREERLGKLQEQIDLKQLDMSDYQWYMDSRRFGSVPHAGFGLGFERMMMFITGMNNIRDVIPLPRYPGCAEF